MTSKVPKALTAQRMTEHDGALPRYNMQEQYMVSSNCPGYQ